MSGSPRRQRCRAGAILLLAITGATLPGAAVAQEVLRDSVFAVERTASVVYDTAPIGAPPGDFELLLDLYEPVGEGVPAPRPGLILVHGAGSHRARPLLVRLAASMAGRGYTAVSIDYREQGQQPVVAAEFEPFRAAFTDSFPGNDPLQIAAWATHAEDATRALRWMVDRSAALDVDPERITMGGISRGATITLSVAYVVGKFGVAMDPPLRVVWEQAGALNGFHDLVDSSDPPLVIIHGTADQVVHFDHAEIIRQHVHRAGVPYDFMPVEGAGHYIDLFRRDAVTPLSAVDRIVSFLYLFVGPPLPVELTAHDLAIRDDRVVVTWWTAAEQDLLGFDLRRAAVGTVDFTRVNASLIRSTGGASGRYEYIDDTVEPGVAYAYRLASVDRDGAGREIELGTVSLPRPAPRVSGGRDALHGAHPNPFNPTTTITFDLAEAGIVRLSIHAAGGRRVRTLVDARLVRGAHAIAWDGRDDRGRRLAAGVYIGTLEVGARVLTRKIVLLE